MARAMQRRCCCPPDSPSALSCSRSLTSSQRAAAAQAPLHDALEIAAALQPEDPRPVGDVLEDGLGERVRLLEDHAHPLAQLGHVHAAVVDVRAPDADVPHGADAVHEVVHPVDAAEQGGLPAARRPDIGGHPVLGDGHGHVLERQLLAVVEGEVVDLDHGALHYRGRLRPRIEVCGDPDVSGHESLLRHGEPRYTAEVAYFRRRRLRVLMAKRLRSTTMARSRRVVANTMGRAASTFGD